jgi:hypothetical protein
MVGRRKSARLATHGRRVGCHPANVRPRATRVMTFRHAMALVMTMR